MFTVGSLHHYMSVDISVKCRSIVNQYVDGVSTNSWSIVGQWLVDVATYYQPTIGSFKADKSQSTFSGWLM